MTLILVVVSSLIAAVLSNDFDYWQGNNEFGFDLLNSFETIANGVGNGNEGQTQTYENILISPFSISSVFALPYAASPQQSATSQQIANALHYPVNKFSNSIHLANHIIKQQNDVFNQSSLKNAHADNNDIIIANRVYFDEKYSLNKEIIDVIGDKYFEKMDFSQNDIAANKINEWISEQTKNKIKNIVAPNAVNNDTFALLVNVCILLSYYLRAYMFDCVLI